VERLRGACAARERRFARARAGDRADDVTLPAWGNSVSNCELLAAANASIAVIDAAFGVADPEPS
jgi:hypothetical protein